MGKGFKNISRILLYSSIEANNNSSGVGTDAGYSSQTALGGLYFTTEKKMSGVSFPMVLTVYQSMVSRGMR